MGGSNKPDQTGQCGLKMPLIYLFARHFCCQGKFGLNGSDYAAAQIQMKLNLFYRSLPVGTCWGFFFLLCFVLFFKGLWQLCYYFCSVLAICVCLYMWVNSETCGVLSRGVICEIERLVLEWTHSGRCQDSLKFFPLFLTYIIHQRNFPTSPLPHHHYSFTLSDTKTRLTCFPPHPQ